MNLTYLDLDELAAKLKFKPKTIMRSKVGSVLHEGIHFVRPLGGKRLLFIWENIERDMLAGRDVINTIPMANGGHCHG